MFQLSTLQRCPQAILSMCAQRRSYSSGQEADIVVIGSGPGGYVAAIKAAQLGMKVSSCTAAMNDSHLPYPDYTEQFCYTFKNKFSSRLFALRKMLHWVVLA